MFNYDRSKAEIHTLREKGVGILRNEEECSKEAVKSAVSNLFGTRDRFCRRQYFHGLGAGGGGVGGSGGNASDGQLQMKLHSLACRSPPAVRPGS